jgi:hypothetical protein
MKQQEMFAAPLGIAGKFEIVETKVGVAANCDVGPGVRALGYWEDRFNCRAVPLHYKPVCRGNTAKRATFRDFQNDGVIKAARTLHDGPATGATAINRDSSCSAGCNVDLRCHFVRVTDDDEILARFPKAEDFFTDAIFAPVEERLVAC